MPTQLNKRDLEIILEVNKKAVEIETAVADQNEEIIALLTSNKNNIEKMDEKLDNLIEEKINSLLKKSEETSKDLFKIRILYVGGILVLIGQVVEIFMKK